MMQHIITINDKYCFISSEIHHSAISPCLGYDWNKKTILNTIKIQIIHQIQNQFFLKIIFSIEIIICTINTQNDMNNHTGYTPSNFVRALLSVSARTANILFVGFQITESHRVKKIQKIIRAFAIEKKRISIQIFLFSVLFMLVKNIRKQIHVAINNPTKSKLKF
jgi:hypothetical protein